MIISFAYENTEHANAIEYIAAEMMLRVGLPFHICGYREIIKDRTDVLISYGREIPVLPKSMECPWIHVFESAFWADSNNAVYPLPQAPVKELEGYPILFWGHGQSSVEAPDADVHPDIMLDADIIASAFFLLSRCEEAASSKRDLHDRFPAEESFAYQHGFLDRPLVDEYATLVSSRLRSIVRLPNRQNPWAPHPYAFCLTHDIDRIQLFDTVRHFASAVRGAFRRHGPSSARVTADYVRTKLSQRLDPYDNLLFLSSLAMDFGARATYLFLAGGATQYDGRYTLDQVKPSIHALVEQGHGIGLHGSYDSCVDSAIMASEVASLQHITNQPIYAVRQHYLRFSAPGTWRIMEGSGLKIDSTLGFAAHEGFRAGTSYPFRAFDVRADRPLGVLEIPLIVMDATLYGYRKLSSHQASAILQEIMGTVKASGGAFVLLWHNSALYSPLYPRGEDLLRSAVAQASADSAYLGTLGDVAGLWTIHREELS